jgi:hypothetical protein
VTVGGIPATAIEATNAELLARQLLPVSSTVLGGDFDGQVYNRQVGFDILVRSQPLMGQTALLCLLMKNVLQQMLTTPTLLIGHRAAQQQVWTQLVQIQVPMLHPHTLPPPTLKTAKQK